MRVMPTLLAGIVCALSILSSSRPAHAIDAAEAEFHGTQKIDFLLQYSADNHIIEQISKSQGITDDTVIVQGSLATHLAYVLSGQLDPSITAFLTVNNPFDTPATVNVSINLNTEPFDPVAWRARGFFDVTLTDGNGNGASLTPKQQFFPDDFLLPSFNVFLTGTKNRVINPTTVAFGGNSIPGLGTSPLAAGHHFLDTGLLNLSGLPNEQFNDMTLQLSFDLSPHDSAIITAGIQIVPEPATAALTLTALPLLLRRRRAAAR